MQFLKDGVLAALIFFNFVVTIVSFLIIYEALTLEKSLRTRRLIVSKPTVLFLPFQSPQFRGLVGKRFSFFKI